MPTCCRAPRSISAMNGSPAICSKKRVQRAHRTQRSRSSSTCAEMLIGLGNRRLLSVNRVSPRPLLIAWFCSGHSPPLSHTGQSSGWLMSRNSICPACAFWATGDVAWVLTTMPSATVIVQEACGFGIPRPLPASGTSTRHCRQAPTGASSGWSQNRGICTPICSAARITRVFLGTETSTPSMVRVTSSDFSGAFCSLFSGVVVMRGPRGIVCGASSASGARDFVGCSCARLRRLEDRGGRPVEGTATVLEVGEVLLAEVLDRRGDRADRAVGQRAEGAAEDVVADVVEQVQVGLGAATLLEVGQGLCEPPGALTAGRALAARLVLVELGPAQHGSCDARGCAERSH